MKKLLFLSFLLVTGLLWVVFNARIKVDLAAVRFDPGKLKLRATHPPLVRSASVSGKIQAGLVELPDGERVKFWFISHHLGGTGCARFDFNDGTRKYVMGDYFCCEVQISDQEVKNRRDLLAFIERHGEP